MYDLKTIFVQAAVFDGFLLDSRTVVRTLTGDLALTFRANVSTMWLRRVPVLRGLVRFLGLPITY
jgi:hypothetical protein